MVVIYARWICTGKITLDQVPERCRAEVEAHMAEESAAAPVVIAEAVSE